MEPDYNKKVKFQYLQYLQKREEKYNNRMKLH